MIILISRAAEKHEKRPKRASFVHTHARARLAPQIFEGLAVPRENQRFYSSYSHYSVYLGNLGQARFGKR